MYQNKIEKDYTEQDFKSLLVSRADIEKILEVTITTPIDTEYLKDYSMFEYIRLEEVIAIFLGLNPKNHKTRNNHPRYLTIYKAIEIAVRNNALEAKVEQDFDVNGNEIQYDIYLSHKSANQWAKTHNLNWNVEPYRDINQNSTYSQLHQIENEIIQQQTNQIAELQARIAELEAEKQNLKKSEAVNEAVNYDECSIYGHSTPSIKAIFGTIKRFWINADLTQPDTVANAEDIEKWIAENYDVSNILKQAIQKITRPEEARRLGRKS